MSDIKCGVLFRNKSIVIWLSILILCGINVYYLFAEENLLNKQFVQYLFYLLDYHHWPFWYAVNLWIIAVTLLLASAVNIPRVEKGKLLLQDPIFKICPKISTRLKGCSRLSPLSRICLVMVFGVTVFCSKWLHAFVYHWLWQPLFHLLKYPLRIIYHYYFSPLTFFMIDGTVSRRLFVAPLTGIVVIILLLYLKKRIIKHHDKKRSVES